MDGMDTGGPRGLPLPNGLLEIPQPHPARQMHDKAVLEAIQRQTSLLDKVLSEILVVLKGSQPARPPVKEIAVLQESEAIAAPVVADPVVANPVVASLVVAVPKKPKIRRRQ